MEPSLPPTLQIHADRETLAMGESVHIHARLSQAQDQLLLPYVNGRRWGAHERPGPDGSAVWSLPLPNPGPARIEVIAVPAQPGWMGHDDPDLLLAGRPMPASPSLRSNALLLEVSRRSFPRRAPGDSLFVMQCLFNYNSH